MSDAPSKKRWDKENTVLITVKFMRKTDSDVIEQLKQGKRRQIILRAVREYMENHPEEREEADG